MWALGLGLVVVPRWVLVAVATAVADDAVVAGADAALLAALDGEPAAVFEPDPPHAASSSTSDPSPAAAANPLLRITSLQFARITLPREPSARERWNLRRVDQLAPPTMLLSDILTTCHTPPTPLPWVTSGFAPLKVYSGMPL